MARPQAVGVTGGPHTGPLADQVGRALERVDTPALVLDLALLRRNVDAMAAWARDVVGLRPHAKIHKCPQVAQLQMEAGAVGVTTATPWEAMAMLDAGVPEVLIANQVVDLSALSLLAARAREATLLLAVDAAEGVERASRAAAGAGSTFGVLIDVDVGMGRGGVRDVESARALAARVGAAPGLELRGAMGYEGHVVLERDPERRASLAREAMDRLAGYVLALREDGMPIEVVSAGGTNTYETTGRHDVVTELQAGTYALMDTAYQPFAPRFEPALSVIGTVVSAHGDRIVLDCGSKVIAATPLAGARPFAAGLAVDALDEEHALLSGGATPGAPVIGERVRLAVPYCGGTTNLHGAYLVAEGEEVVDVWPIRARGAGRRA